MAVDADLEPWLRLTLLPGLGSRSLRKLLVSFGSPEKVLAASHRALCEIVSEKNATAIRNGDVDAVALNEIAEWLDYPENHVVTFADPCYPQVLLQIADPPPLLYAKGCLDLLNHPGFAIVGSRNATAQGLDNAEAFATLLSNAALTIVSGLALGVDAAAHRGGLAGASSTVAVVGTGLDKVYPARNRDLAHHIAGRGLLLSEFALGTPPLAANFPRRNRLICGLSRGCLVVEAALSSGSLITARLAADQGRDVFAIPGSIHSPLTKGCHALIKQGAKLVESAQDILEELGLSAADPAGKPVVMPMLSASNPDLLAFIGFDPVHIDTLQQRSGLDAAAINAGLTALELEGLIEILPGGSWQRVR